MLADGNDDLVAAINEDGRTSPLVPWTERNLNNRDGKQRNKKDDHGTHMIPSAGRCAVEVIISGDHKIDINRTLRKCILRENWP
jgi:hypothetical protein